VHPVLLDSSFLIALERELARGIPGPAIASLRRERGRHQRALIVSSVSLAEVMEGAEDGGGTRRSQLQALGGCPGVRRLQCPSHSHGADLNATRRSNRGLRYQIKASEDQVPKRVNPADVFFSKIRRPHRPTREGAPLGRQSTPRRGSFRERGALLPPPADEDDLRMGAFALDTGLDLVGQ
jgi:hypothetical protein